MIGEAYFRVSKHLSIPIEEVILKKFTIGMRLLLNKYYNIIVAEQKEYKKIEEMQRNMPNTNSSNFKL